MSVAAAVRIDSPEAATLIARAAEFARRGGNECFVISVVPELPDVNERTIARNLETIAEHKATMVMQEGDEVAGAIVSAARWFGVRTLFISSGRHRFLRRTLAERLLALAPPFELIVLTGASA